MAGLLLLPAPHYRRPVSPVLDRRVARNVEQTATLTRLIDIIPLNLTVCHNFCTVGDWHGVSNSCVSGPAPGAEASDHTHP